MLRILTTIATRPATYSKELRLVLLHTVSQEKNIMSPKKNTSDILNTLRCLMVNPEVVQTPLKAYIVPTADAHQSESTAQCDNRREFVTGFNGSAGTAVITSDKALLWTDGRYFIQAASQLDSNWIIMKDRLPETPSIGEWLSTNLGTGSYVGVDPNLYSHKEYADLEKKLRLRGVVLCAVQNNLVDIVWKGKPGRPMEAVKTLPLQYSGKRVCEKLNDVQQEMKKHRVSHLILNSLDEVAWILNLRGSDVPHNPVEIFIDAEKVDQNVKDDILKEIPLTKFWNYEDMSRRLQDIIRSEEVDMVWLSNTCNHAISEIVPKEKRHFGTTPVCNFKAVKNETEVKGMINCHVRDGAALIEYFAWLEKELESGKVITEVTGAEQLHQFRATKLNFINESFSTISGSGPNSAIIHYSPDPLDCREINQNEIYLVDSGGQYLDGTTDTTRTLHFGTPTEFQKFCFTLVLKGQIALTSAVFPEGTIGNKLDSLARQFLWKEGLDYNHGTGHGVGSYLNVHEGPIGITFRHLPDDPGLKENMFVSNEPGYYENGFFGIRLENVIRTVTAKTKHNFNNKVYLGFEDVTLVPIQQKLINREMLTDSEVNYINEYHESCRDIVGGFMREYGATEDAYKWLMKETRPI